MSNPLQAMLQAPPLKHTLFPPTSRYHGLDVKKMECLDGKELIYLTRRFLPQPEQLSLLQEHMVSESDRLDNIAALHLNDPERFWLICDANRALRPDELTEIIGRRLRITLPDGVLGL